MTSRMWLLLTVLFALTCGCTQRDPAAEYTLTYASPYPPSHPFSRADLRWMKFVEEGSAGRLHIRPYWGGALLSSDQSVIEIRHGVADIGLITPIYMRGGVHASRGQAGFYGGVRTIADQVAVLKCLEQTFPVFRDEMHGLRILALQGGNFPGVLTRSKAIHSLSDLQGMRLRTQSESMDVLRQLGADPVDMPMNDVYSAMAKGVIDGVVAPADALRSVHLAEVGSYFTQLRFSRGSYPARAMSEKAWQRLPPDLQQLLLQSQSFWEQAMIDEIETAQQLGFDFATQRGVQILSVSDAEQQRFDEVAHRSARHRAESLQEYGIDGVAILNETQRLIHARARGEVLDCKDASDGKPVGKGSP